MCFEVYIHKNGELCLVLCFESLSHMYRTEPCGMTMGTLFFFFLLVRS